MWENSNYGLKCAENTSIYNMRNKKWVPFNTCDTQKWLNYYYISSAQNNTVYYLQCINILRYFEYIKYCMILSYRRYVSIIAIINAYSNFSVRRTPVEVLRKSAKCWMRLCRICNETLFLFFLRISFATSTPENSYKFH